MNIPVGITTEMEQPNLFKSVVLVSTWPFRALWNNGIACVAVGQLLNAVCGVLISHLATVSMPFFQSLVVRSLFGTLVFWMMHRAVGGKGFTGSSFMWMCFMLASLFGAVHSCALFLGFELLPAGDAMAIGNLTPAFAVALVWIMRLEAMHWFIVMGVVVCTFGGVLISHPPIMFGGSMSWGSARFAGLMIELAGSLVGGVSCVLISIIGDDINSQTFVSCMYLETAVLSAVALIVGYPSAPVLTISWRQGAPLLAFTILSSSASLVTVRGFQIANPTLSTTMLTLGTVFSYVFGFFFLHQSITIWVITGTILIGIGIWAVSVGRTRSRVQAVDDGDTDHADEPLLAEE